VSSGGRFSAERAPQPDFLTPYLKFVLGTIGLHDLTFILLKELAPARMLLATREPGQIKRYKNISVRLAIDL
jgi:FMN-dependent NADH-azoreductase